MIKYDDIVEVNSQLKESQEAENDNREMVREVHDFLDKRDGQWEPSIVSKMGSRPRYTFDKCNPIVDGIAGEMEGSDFAINVMPAGGDATKEIAKTYDGLIRNIETISNANHTYNAAAREMIAAGIGGWEVKVDWVDGDSFDQDFIIEGLPDFENRVWFDVGATKQDMSDAKHVFVLDNLTREEYESRFPDGSKQSIGSDKSYESYTNKPAFITVGRMIYKKEVMIDLVLMSDGSVYEDNDDFKSVVDELAEQGITIERTRKKTSHKVMSRIFDGGGFLTDAEETVFKSLPIVPIYGNFKVREGKVIYRGAIEKLMDAQRSYNYSRSRELEDVALSPPSVLMATRTQLAKGNDLSNFEQLPTSGRRVATYSVDEKAPPPFTTAPPQISAGLQQATQNSIDDIQTSSARAPLQNGDIDRSLSGVAINALNSRSDTGTIKYFKAVEIAICYTARLLIDAIPSLYDTTTQKRILNEDGSHEMTELNQTTIDLDTGNEVRLNDLRQGKYDVTCSVGEAFANRQQEAVAALNDLSQSIPGLGEITADIMLKNINAPSVNIAAERVRRRLIENGSIPDSQLTDEERAELQRAQQVAAQQPQEPTPDQQIAQAEVARVEAETQDVIAKAQLKQEELRIKEQKDLLDAQNKASKLELEELALTMKQQAAQVDQQNAMIEASIKGQAQVFDSLNTQANTLKLLADAMGVQAIAGSEPAKAIINQTDTIVEQQENIEERI